MLLAEPDPDIRNATQIYAQFDQESHKPNSDVSFDRIPSTSLSSGAFNDSVTDSYDFAAIPVTNASTYDPNASQYLDEPQVVRDIDALMEARAIQRAARIQAQLAFERAYDGSIQRQLRGIVSEDPPSRCMPKSKSCVVM